MALELCAGALQEPWDLVITSPFMNEAGVLLGKNKVMREVVAHQTSGAEVPGSNPAAL